MRKDIDFSFKAHPLTGDLATKSGSSAIRQSLINIVRTNFHDRGFNIEVGSNLDASMFENVTLLTAQTLKTNITNSVRNFEPQVELVDVAVTDDENTVNVELFYTELNNPNIQSVIIDLERIR